MEQASFWCLPSTCDLANLSLPGIPNTVCQQVNEKKRLRLLALINEETWYIGLPNMPATHVLHLQVIVKQFVAVDVRTTLNQGIQM